MITFSQALVVLVVKNLSAGDIRDTGLIPGWEDPLEKDMATHCSVLAWRIPCSPWGHKELDMTEQLSMHTPGTKCSAGPYWTLSSWPHANPTYSGQVIS